MSDKSSEEDDLAPLSAWAPELAKTFVSLASDIALVIDETGVIRNVAQGGADPIAPGAQRWIGRAWIDTVSGDTRPKIENLLREVATNGIARRREVNHPLGADSSIPVAYTAIRLGENGPVLAVGRDLRATAAIQQRYVDSQQEMERGYWQARQAEARQQLLHQVPTDAVLVVDGETLAIVEANDVAAALFGRSVAELPGRHAAFGFEHHSRGAVNELLAQARTTGLGGEIRARLQGTLDSTSVVATSFRSDQSMRLLVRVRTNPSPGPSEALSRSLSRLVDNATDGVVVTDSSGRILLANRAFLSLAGLATEAQAKGRALMTWLRLADQPLAALMATVRREGIARHVGSCVAPEGSSPAARIEISAALLTEGDQECIGFTIHPVQASAAIADDSAGEQLWATLRARLETMAAALGHRDFAELLRDATELAERHLIDLALKRCAGDVPSASALTGLSIADLQHRLDAADPTTQPQPGVTGGP